MLVGNNLDEIFMNKKYYTSERNVQIVIALLKAHGIKRVIASPGTTNMTFIGSIQNDSWFEIYSSVDERSAAYLALVPEQRHRETICRDLLKLIIVNFRFLP